MNHSANHLTGLTNLHHNKLYYFIVRIDYLFSRLNTYIKGSAPASFWMQSPPNSIFKTIFEQNMDDSSFNTYKESMVKTINEPNEAFYGSFMNIQQEKMDCKVFDY